MFFAKSENEKTVEEKSKREALQTLRLLYPIFKEEVYRRRAAIAQIARFGVFFNVILSLLFIFFSEKSPLESGLRYASTTGVILLTVLLIYQMTQEKSRHEKAKLQLITLEKGFGFFETGHYLPNKALCPSEWQDRPKVDPGLFVMSLLLVGTAGILIFTIFAV